MKGKDQIGSVSMAKVELYQPRRGQAPTAEMRLYISCPGESGMILVDGSCSLLFHEKTLRAAAGDDLDNPSTGFSCAIGHLPYRTEIK